MTLTHLVKTFNIGSKMFAPCLSHARWRFWWADGLSGAVWIKHCECFHL